MENLVRDHDMGAKKMKKKIMKKVGSIGAYIKKQKLRDAAICKVLKKEIDAGLPKASSKIYHRIPVWFIGENAVVGFYVSAKKGVVLLFWNGQKLGEPELKKEGSFNAAQVIFQDVKEIKKKNLRRWLKKAGKKIWDFAGIRKMNDA